MKKIFEQVPDGLPKRCVPASENSWQAQRDRRRICNFFYKATRMESGLVVIKPNGKATYKEPFSEEVVPRGSFAVGIQSLLTGINPVRQGAPVQSFAAGITFGPTAFRPEDGEVEDGEEVPEDDLGLIIKANQWPYYQHSWEFLLRAARHIDANGLALPQVPPPTTPAPRADKDDILSRIDEVIG